MTAYILRRLGQCCLVVLGVTIVAFSVIHLLPGSPARALLGPRALPNAIHQFNVANGYYKPLWVQYVKYMGRLLTGNFGYSYHYNQSVGSLLVENLPKSAVLVGLSYIVALGVAIILGLLQAVRRNSPFDHLITSGAMIGYAMPVFWLGILLILAFSVRLHGSRPKVRRAALSARSSQIPRHWSCRSRPLRL